MSLPAGYPDRIAGPLAWSGKDFDATPEVFEETLDALDVREIEEATKHFRGLGIPRGFADRDTFPLSQALADRLGEITDVVYSGRGFHLLRGLDTSGYTEEERVVMYAGITSYVANKRARNIDHIRDRTHANPRGEELRPLELSIPMTFHTDIDSGDMLSMFTQTTPLEGGQQYLASMASIYNYLAEADQGVLKTLSENWYWERPFRPAPDEEILRVYNRPLIGFEGGQLQVNCAATFVGGNSTYPLSSAAPPLSPQQKHALQALQEAAMQCCLKIDPQPGDILFVNNFALLHARNGWVDSKDDPENMRYIMRLWLHDDQKGWSSAPVLKRKLDDDFDLPPEKQGLMTGVEWDALPRSWRVKEMGVTASLCHD